MVQYIQTHPCICLQSDNPIGTLTETRPRASLVLRRVVLREVLVVVRAEHRLVGVAVREVLRGRLAVRVVLRPSVHGEVRRLG